MRPSNKYFLLFEYLRLHKQHEVILSIAEIEALVGQTLPPSAWNKRAWWSNRSGGASQAKAWMEAGYHVEKLDLGTAQITFRKPKQSYKVEHKGDTVLWNRDLVKDFRRYNGWSQDELAKELGIRQQTISEWENKTTPLSRSMSKHLQLIAERTGFTYGETP